MIKFKVHDTETAAKITGYSVRHFRRLAIESGNPGLDFGTCGHGPKFKYTDEQIARIKEYASNHPDGRANRKPGKVLRKTQSKLVSGR